MFQELPNQKKKAYHQNRSGRLNLPHPTLQLHYNNQSAVSKKRSIDETLAEPGGLPQVSCRGGLIKSVVSSDGHSVRVVSPPPPRADLGCAVMTSGSYPRASSARYPWPCLRSPPLRARGARGRRGGYSAANGQWVLRGAQHKVGRLARVGSFWICCSLRCRDGPLLPALVAIGRGQTSIEKASSSSPSSRPRGTRMTRTRKGGRRQKEEGKEEKKERTRRRSRLRHLSSSRCSSTTSRTGT